MSYSCETMGPADIAAVTGNYGNNGGMFGNNEWSWIIVLLLFGYGGRGFGGGFGGGCGTPATQADLAAGFNNSAVLSSLNDIKLGQANAINYNNQGFSGLNTSILQGFHGVDNAVCTLGYQTQQVGNAIQHQISDCCCETKGAIKDVGTQSIMNTNAIQQQISSCCCDLEKMNMQNRFDAQGYNCNTLQAIDKLGDRIIDYMAAEKAQALRDENQALRLAASQSAQNNYLVNQLRPCPVPAYITCNPFAASYGCGNSCGNF